MSRGLVRGNATDSPHVACQNPHHNAQFCNKSLFNDRIDSILCITLNQSGHVNAFAFLAFIVLTESIWFSTPFQLQWGTVLYSSEPPLPQNLSSPVSMPSVRSALCFCKDSDLDWIGSIDKWRWVDWVPTPQPLVYMESFSFHSLEHIMKDTAHLRAKFELDNGITTAARGQSSCSRVLCLWVLRSKGTSEAVLLRNK